MSLYFNPSAFKTVSCKMEEGEEFDLALLDSRVLSNEGAVVELIRKRYAHDKIYTAIGDILISVNPFKYLPIYGPEWIHSYQLSKSRKGFSPHVYLKAKDVLRSLYFSSESQCCVVMGDSAAGKTEAVKHILQYITFVSKSTDAKIASRLLQVHCIVEAFGNATMLQNKNSSRFALYLELLFSRDCKLSGGQVHHYMLEKSRLVHQEKGGKNFHIFHYLLSGMSDDQLQEYSISGEYPHRYLSYDPMVPPVDEVSKGIESEKFTTLLSCMESLGFTSTDIHQIFKVLAAVLHVGNVAFGTVNSQTNAAFIRNQQPVHCASALLAVDIDDLGTSLVMGTAFHKGEKVSIRKNAEIAGQGRDNLAKALYGRLFSWIIFKINSCLLGNIDAVSRQPAVGPSLGLLDVFGFEKFDVNGLEQLCVNMTNEQLAYFYNERVFAWEQAELESDGLRPHKTPYPDNRKALELLLSPPQGLLPLLDEESKSPKASDAAYVKKCDGVHKKQPHYNVAKLSYPAFHIQHHTGNVSYVALGFTNTNLDLLGNSLLQCMQGSRDGFISSLFKARVTGTGSLDLQSERNVPVSNNTTQRRKDKKSPTVRHKEAVLQYMAFTDNRSGFPTLASQFRNSIAELMHKVLACDVHFVRCIKPNNQQCPNRFEPDTVLVQARSSAVIPTAHAKSVGFPVWFRFDVFINRFGILVGLPPHAVTKDASQTCQNMLRKLADPRGWKIGKTKVFLMYWCAERLNTLMDGASRCAAIIQKVLKGWCARKLYRRLKHHKVIEEKTVGAFLAAIGNQSEEMFQHTSNQVMEEDAREKRKRSELAALQKETWSPAKLGQRSPAAMISVGLDVPDAAVQSQQPFSPPTSPQQRVSDLSLSSLTDVFITNSPERPETLKKRESKLSITSVDSSFSESGDVEVPSQVWCKVTCFERQFPRGEYTIDRPTIIIDGSSNAFDVTRIGLGALPASPDSKVTKVRSYIGKGIQIKNDEDGNVWVTRGSKNPVFVKGHFLSEEVVSNRGSLIKDKTVKVFDWDSFVDEVRHHCQPQVFNSDLVPDILTSASIFISFVKDANEDVETPCWVQLDVLAALEQAKAAFKFAAERKNEERQQKLNSMPAILRPRPGTRARELLAVANAERNVRPQRYIDTAKFGRKAWARKEVSVNPFLYGKKDELSTLGRRSLEEPRAASVNSSVESSPGTYSPVLQSISAAFGGGTDSDQVATMNNSGFSLGSPVSPPRDAVDANPSPLAAYEVQPKKKVWARKKSAEGKTK